MKWKLHLNGEGCYWWVAQTPVGPFYVCSEIDNRVVHVEWYPMDTKTDDPVKVAKVASEDAGKEAAEAYLRELSRKLKRWLK